MIHEMKVASEPFVKIASNKKVIESRLFDEKRQRISVGDVIVFREGGNEQHTVVVRVTDLIRHDTFMDLFNSIDPAYFGGESPEALLAEIRGFYTPEDEAQYGVVGVRFIHESAAH